MPTDEAFPDLAFRMGPSGTPVDSSSHMSKRSGEHGSPACYIRVAALTFGLIGALVPDNFCFHKGCEFLEGLLQDVIIHLIAEVSHKYPAGHSMGDLTSALTYEWGPSCHPFEGGMSHRPECIHNDVSAA